MGFFELLEETSIALWVGESLRGYPIMLSLHAVGLSIVVGIFTMLNLRILGLLKDNELSALKASGISIKRISIPLIILGIILSIFSFYFDNLLVTNYLQKRIQLSTKYNLGRSKIIV